MEYEVTSKNALVVFDGAFHSLARSLALSFFSDCDWVNYTTFPLAAISKAA